MFRAIRIVAVLSVVALGVAAVGQTFTVLHSFCSPTDCSDGGVVVAWVTEGKDGNFYGTTLKGAAGYGTVYRVTPAGTLTVLHTFTGKADGGNPNAGLIQGSDGNFYGTTLAGTVFKMTPSGALTTLHNFGSSEEIYAGLVQGTDGNFYGATEDRIFRITSSGALTTLHTFSGTDGNEPIGALIQASDGNFYGTTSAGGSSASCSGGCGTVFKITPKGAFTTLHSFSYTDGADPWAALLQATDGDFYGTTYTGANNGGTVFKITSTGVLTTLAAGINSYGSLIQDSNGNFYGTSAYQVSAQSGSVFKMTSTGAMTTLYRFDGTDGYDPFARVTLGSDGNLYGTTLEGGAYRFDQTKCPANGGCGTVFRLKP